LLPGEPYVSVVIASPSSSLAQDPRFSNRNGDGLSVLAQLTHDAQGKRLSAGSLDAEVPVVTERRFARVDVV
jgi:hypothetical protein